MQFSENLLPMRWCQSIQLCCECRVCTASVDGQLCVWDCASVNVLLLNRVQLDIDDRSLSSIRCHRDQFLCCTLMLVLSCLTSIC